MLAKWILEGDDSPLARLRAACEEVERELRGQPEGADEQLLQDLADKLKKAREGSA